MEKQWGEASLSNIKETRPGRTRGSRVPPGCVDRFQGETGTFSLRRVLAGKLGIQTNQIKFDKVARKLIRISDGTVLGKQSIMTWRATPISDD